MRRVRCRSGLHGWQKRLRKVYRSFEEFLEYCSLYNNHTRLGFTTPEKAWMANPVVRGSVVPSDYRRVK